MDNDNNKISRVMAGGGDCPIKSDNDRKRRIMNRGRAKNDSKERTASDGYFSAALRRISIALSTSSRNSLS